MGQEAVKPVGGGSGEGATLRNYLQVVRRRKWVPLQPLIIIPTVAVLFSLSQEPLYQGTAEVLLSRQNLAASLTGTEDPSFRQDDERVISTQAELARLPVVAERALSAAGVRDRTTKEFLDDDSTVRAKASSDLLEFGVIDRNPQTAERLATEYARQFTRYRLELDTAAIDRALAAVNADIARLQVADEEMSPLYASLQEKFQQLRTLKALQTSNALLVRSATDAEQVQPKPVRNGVLGLILGLVAGLGLVFLVEALDTRVRSSDQVGEELGLPLLARIPPPPRKLRQEHGLIMLAEPTSPEAEGFRMLRANLDFARMGGDTRVMMVTSAVSGEGKSTTIANLALAHAQAGRRVVLVDLDLRRPLIGRFFGLEERPGMTNVLLGQAELEDALASISVTGIRDLSLKLPSIQSATSPPARVRDRISALEEVTALRTGLPVRRRIGTTPDNNGTVAGEEGGTLEVLTAGRIPPNPGDIISSGALTLLLNNLRDRADTVLIDVPPLLMVGDSVTLSAKVDAVIIVARLELLRRGTLGELGRVLKGIPAEKLGFVETGAKPERDYGYAYGYSERHQQHGRRGKDART